MRTDTDGARPIGVTPRPRRGARGASAGGARPGRRAAWTAVVLAALVAAPHPVFADASGTWTSFMPSGRRGLSAILDPVRARLIVFGGFDGTHYLNDVWAIPLSDPSHWEEIEPAGTPPPGRAEHTATYDPFNDRMIVFGGTADYTERNDVHALSLSGTPTWTALAPQGTPPGPRRGHSAMLDPLRGRVLVHDGKEGFDYWPSIYSDTWAFDVGGSGNWYGMPVGALESLAGHSAVYDPIEDRMLVWGGQDSHGPRNDLYSLPLGDSENPYWRKPYGTDYGPPPARSGHGALFDPVENRMIVFGGDCATCDDTWELVLTGDPRWEGNWYRLNVGGAKPPALWEAGSIFDPGRRRIFMFGGSTTGAPCLSNDLWTFPIDGSDWTLVPAAMVLPPAGRYTMVRDPVRNRMLAFAVDSATAKLWTCPLPGPPAWTVLETPGLHPAARLDYSAIYDPIRDRVILFGGGPPDRNDLWELRLGDAPEWHLLNATGTPPPPRHGHKAIYDPIRDRMLVYGGEPLSQLVWSLWLGGTTPEWEAFWPEGPLPPYRTGHTLIYDPVRDRMIVFGGYYGSTSLNDTWEMTMSAPETWFQLSTGTAPSIRVLHSAVYDPVRDRMVVYGGAHYSTGTGPRDDAWALSLSNLTWTSLSPSGSPAPFRYGHSAIYDPASDRMVFSGGAGGGACNEMWSLDWGEPAKPDVSCPAVVVADPGTTASLPCPITNPLSGVRAVEWTIESARHWPGFPMRGRSIVSGGATQLLQVQLPVPDTAAVGLDPLRVIVAFAGAAGFADTCATLIGNLPTGGIGGDVPGHLAFAVRAVRPNPVHGAMSVELTLPTPGTVRVEIFDGAGRRIGGARAFDLPAGPRIVPLGGGRARAPGVYVLRASFAGRSVEKRFVVLR